MGTDMVKKDQIPHDKMMEIVEDCIEMKVAAVTFSGGGEPFCYPHLVKSAQKLSEAVIRIASLTNGGRLTGEAAEVFAQLGTWIRFSMDGWDGPSYGKFRIFDLILKYIIKILSIVYMTTIIRIAYGCKGS